MAWVERKRAEKKSYLITNGLTDLELQQCASLSLLRYVGPKLFSFQPMEVYVDDEAKLTLHGLQQHYVKLKDAEKNRKLFELLDVLEFNQVVIFVKSVQRCTALAQLLIEQNFPAIAIHRGMNQEERLARYQQFKDFQKVRQQGSLPIRALVIEGLGHRDLRL